MRRFDPWLDAQAADTELRAAGVVEWDEPTWVSHEQHRRTELQRLGGEFTAQERKRIRLALHLADISEETSE